MNPGPQSQSTEGNIYFYPPEFYVFDNFSAFQIEFEGKTYPTSEHAYHSQKFIDNYPELAEKIRLVKSAHDALKIAELNKKLVGFEWEKKKVIIAKKILLCKVMQHEYVKKKLTQSGNRIIIEDSWRDSYWGWGKDHDGKNMLGKIWMEIREELYKDGYLKKTKR